MCHVHFATGGATVSSPKKDSVPANSSGQAALIYAGSFKLNFNGDQTKTDAFIATPDAKTKTNTWVLIGLNSLIILLSIYCIILFKNRPRQLLISRGLVLLTLIFVVVGVYAIDGVKTAFDGDLADIMRQRNLTAEMVSTKYYFDLGTFMPVISFLMFLLAGRFIIKDERLVRSADRLR
jgi:hypothetical protein